MNIKITSDSTCDLPQQMLEAYKIDTVPLYIVKDGTPFKDGVEIKPADIFSFTEATGKLCSTASVNTYDYVRFFTDLSKKYKAVIHVSLGSGFSSCYQNACIAAQNFKNVYVIDSRSLSLGQGLVVLEAAKRAGTKMKPQAICDEVNALTDKVDGSFLLDRLDYMVKGGRCSTVAALGANLLHLKPCIELTGGNMRVAKKYRGTFSKCVCEFIKERLNGCGGYEPERVFVHSTAMEPEVVNAAAETVRSCALFEDVVIAEAGCSISCHCGPHAFGLFFIRK